MSVLSSIKQAFTPDPVVEDVDSEFIRLGDDEGRLHLSPLKKTAVISSAEIEAVRGDVVAVLKHKRIDPRYATHMRDADGATIEADKEFKYLDWKRPENWTWRFYRRGDDGEYAFVGDYGRDRELAVKQAIRHMKGE